MVSYDVTTKFGENVKEKIKTLKHDKKRGKIKNTV